MYKTPSITYDFDEQYQLMEKSIITIITTYNINVVFGFDETKYSIDLSDPALSTLEKKILEISDTLFLNARKIYLRDVPLTDQNIEVLLKNEATYRVHFNQFGNCPEMCDIYLFRVID